MLENIPLDIPSRAHLSFEAVAAAARTVTENSDDIKNLGFRGVTLYLDITAASGTTPTLDIKLQTKDPVSDGYVDMPGAAFAQKTGAGSDTLTVYPGVGETANRSVSDVLPEDWRIVSTIGGTTPSFTYSIGAVYLR